MVKKKADWWWFNEGGFLFLSWKWRKEEKK